MSVPDWLRPSCDDESLDLDLALVAIGIIGGIGIDAGIW
jgi:hypothetical protein